MAGPVLMSRRHLPDKSTSRLLCIKKSAPKIGCLTTINVHEYSLFSPTSTISLLVPYVVIVELFAATKGRLSAFTVLLAQDRGKTLTAAPVSIKYLHLLRLSATYSSLEGDNLENSVITQSCRVSFGSPDTRVATLCWLNSFKAKAQYRGLCTNALYHQISDDSSKSVHRP